MKIGVIGSCGSIGRRHADNLKMLGHQVMGFDPASGRSDVRFERNVYEECEAVVIATPTNHHVAGLRACAERGKHALIEKPISLDGTSIRHLLDLAKDKNLVVMTGNNLRFHPCVLQARSWIGLGLAGRPLWAHFTCAIENSVTNVNDGVILNVGAHEVDLALYFFGPGEVVNANARSIGRTDVIANFVIEHQSGVRSSFLLNWETPNRIREFWVACDGKNIGVDLDQRRASIGSDVHQCPGSYDDDYVDEMRAFIGRIDGKVTPGATGDDGLATVELLNWVRKKAGVK